MALLIKKTVTRGQMSKDGCYIQIKPYLIYGLKSIPADRGIWGSKEDFEENTLPTIANLDQIDSAFTIETKTIPTTDQGKDVLLKMLWWASTEVKAQILAKNPDWSDSDIEIVDIPKS